MRDLGTLLDALDAKLADLRAMTAEAREPAAPAKSEPGGYWSPWLEWRGGKDAKRPLPPGVDIDLRYLDGRESPGMSHRVHWDAPTGVDWSVRAFRYRAPDKLGWLDFNPEKWTPPDALFEPDCPVRLEWAADAGHEFVTGFNRLEGWGGVHYVRLVARERKAALPEGWVISGNGGLMAPDGTCVIRRSDVCRHEVAAIRQAVDAWLREMGR